MKTYWGICFCFIFFHFINLTQENRIDRIIRKLQSQYRRFGLEISCNGREDLVCKVITRAASTNIFEEDFLKAHNHFRKKHGVPPLVLSRKLSHYAEEWAKNLLKMGSMVHREQSDYGENIFYAKSSDPKYFPHGREPVESWYSEIEYYKYGTEDDERTLHFTQVVWEDTKEVGVGVARSEEGDIYVVANYYPPGNIIEEFAKKVHPPI